MTDRRAASITEHATTTLRLVDLVEIVARQISQSIGSVVDYGDILSAGNEGLLDAARRFDAGRGVPFRVYANFRVRGAIFDGIRQFARLPRRAYERLAALEAASTFGEGLVEQTFVDPFVSLDDGELEEALEEQLAAMATATAVAVVADANRAVLAVSSESAGADPEQAYSRAELLAHVESALRELEPEREAEIVRLHYLEGMSMDAIARELNIDKSWASRLHTRAMARLTKRLRGIV